MLKWEAVVDEPEVKVYAHGLKGETTPGGPPGEAPATAVVSYQGVKVLLRFAPGDLYGEGDVQEMWIRPGTEPLEPRVLRRVAPQAEMLLAFARSAMRLLAPPDEDGKFNVEQRWATWQASADALREVGRTRRGLSDRFYRTIADQYTTLIAEGEPNPVKTLGEIHHVTISAASRWIKEARRREYIKEDSK
jgi:hypothetical protein